MARDEALGCVSPSLRQWRPNRRRSILLAMRKTPEAPEGSDGAVGERPTGQRSGSDETQIRTFLIADVRGYTAFTQERGDEAAAALVSRFAEVVRQRVEANEGSLLELRGDEALAVFASPRRAIRAAVELQASALDHTRGDPTLPLPVGIGLDTGEAVPVGDGYRGGALNLAARLCGEAGPGEIVGSQTVVHLARTLDGIAYLDRGDVQLKGLRQPVRLFSIASSAEDVPAQMAGLLPLQPQRQAIQGRLQFRILGPVEVGQDDQSLPIGGPRQRAVLAHLLIRANEVVSAEGLVDAVWGDQASGSARNTLYTYISHLRAALGPDRILSQTLGYRLRIEPTELDAARFEQLLRDAEKAKAINPRSAAAVLDEALGLWRGPALADVAEEGALLAEATRLNELRLGATEERFEALLATGQQSPVISEAAALVDRHPLRERIWQQLMLALYREGRQAEALNAYQRVREVLADELGIDPSPELARLHERILRQDPSLELRGEPLRGYRLLEKIGEGPTGVVFRAIQPRVGRDVAVKIVHERLASDPSFVRAFEHDAQAFATLEHPRIVPVYDYWREPGHAYIVSRYLKEGSQRGRETRGEQLGRARALKVVEEIAGALAFAHARHVVHGSVGPSNVLFDGEGNAYLGDFRIGIRFTHEAVDADIRGLASLARSALSSEGIPQALAELLERATAGSSSVTAAGIAAAATARAEAAAVPTQPAVDLRNPYKGLRAFTEADAQDFFGRAELTTRLLSRLAGTSPGSRCLAVVGPSGAGKSSVVRAGVVPAIRDGALGDPERLFVTEMFPGQHPIDELEAALLRVATHRASRLADLLAEGSRGLLDAIDHVLPAPAELVLVVDQFEEVFTLTSDEHERELLLESLRVATADPESRLRLIVTLRADFYDRPLVYPRFGELLAASTEVVAPLTPDETEQAIRRPAEGVGLSVESGLLAEIVADVAHQPGALPLLQYGLTELFERREGDRLTLDAYRQFGGVAGALTARAERIIDALSSEGKRASRQVLLRLVTLGEGREDTRRRVVRSELDALEVDTRVVDQVVDTFGRHRLLTFDRDPSTREPTVEIAHEALLGAWGRLRTWIDDARDDLRQDRRLARAAAEWRGSGREPSFLVRGTRLQQLEAWASSTDLAIGQPEREYLKASLDLRDREVQEEEARVGRERALERRSGRRMRGLVAVLTVAALVAATLTFISVDQRRRAERAETTQLAQRLGAQALVEEDLDVSLLLARQAVAIDDSPQTRSYLFADLGRFPAVAGVMYGRTDQLESIAVSPDGRTVAVGDYDPGTGLLLFDARTYERIGEPLDVKGGVASVAYAPDGRTVALGGDGYLLLIDARTRERLAAARLEDGTISQIEFTSDGSRLVVVVTRFGEGRDRIEVRDAATLAATGPAIAPEGFGGAYVSSFWQGPQFALTPNGRSAVIAIDDEVTHDDELVWWDLRGGTPFRRVMIGTGRHPLALSPDGRIAAVGVARGFELVDTPNGDRRRVTGAGGETPSWLRFSPDGGTVVSTSLDGTVALWDVESATLIETLDGHSGSVQQPVFSRYGETLYTVSHDGTAIAWDMGGDRGLERRLTFTHDPVPDSNYSGHPGVFSPDGGSIALGLRGQGIGLWDAKTLTPLGPPLWETGGEVKDLAFSQDGRTLAAVSLEGQATVWDVQSGALRAGPFDTEGGFYGKHDVSISADGTLLATTENPGVKLWDVATGESIGTIPAGVGEGSGPPGPDSGGVCGRCAGDIAFSAAGSTLGIVYGKTGTVEIWDVAEGTRITTLPVDDTWGYFAIALSGDARFVATGGFFATVHVWDLRTGELVRDLDLGNAGALTLDFSADDRLLAVSGWEPVASLWDLATGTQIGRSLTAGNGRAEIDLSQDGHRLLLTHADGRGTVYDVDPASWAKRACAIANRTLTPEEWEQFLPGRPYEPACAT